jgi:hypothetical protein
VEVNLAAEIAATSKWREMEICAENRNFKRSTNQYRKSKCQNTEFHNGNFKTSTNPCQKSKFQELLKDISLGQICVLTNVNPSICSTEEGTEIDLREQQPAKAIS